MNKRMTDAFNEVQADDALKISIYKGVQEKSAKPQKRPYTKKIQFVMVAVLCLLLVAGLGGYKSFMTPTAVISFDINPSIELSVNRYNRVIATSYYNEDGQTLLSDENLIYKDYEEAIDSLIASDKVQACLNDGGELVLNVAPKNVKQGEAITTYLSHCTSGMENATCDTISTETMDAAHNLGMSMGRYKVYEAIKAYEPDFSAEACNSMSMRELHDKFNSCAEENEGESDACETQESCHESGDHGHAYGRNSMEANEA